MAQVEDSGGDAAGRTIAFVGFMGAGKTRAANGAAAVLGEPALDLDAAIERELGAPPEEVFERDGESRFREVEERLALEALRRGGFVALGGGAVESDRIREALEDCFTVWCRISEEAAWLRCEGTSRPLAQDRAGFARRFADRAPLYDEVADAVLTDGGERVGRAAARWLRAAAELNGARLAWAESSSGEYPAIVGAGALSVLDAVSGRRAELNGAAASDPRRWFAVGDSGALAHHRGLLPEVAGLIEVEGGESAKTLSGAERVLRELARAGARRDDGVLAFGGGVVGDLAGFCAATYQRGVPVIQAPTTLVAQVDSAYGGKTGVDLPEAKNYAGAYHLPSAVLADPATLATLSREELAAGFAEVLKTALIAGGALWDRVRALDSLDPNGLADVIFACARTKIDVVAADERDSGRRQVLNLGHTVGHAIETASGYGRYRHGEAVGLGLLAALRLSEAEALRDEVAELLARHGLPTALDPGVGTDEVLAAVERDKKADEAGVGFVLLEEPGTPRTGVPLDAGIVRAAVEELVSE
jgi:shikimate kinase / 3-dehydroquinate synthase